MKFEAMLHKGVNLGSDAASDGKSAFDRAVEEAQEEATGKTSDEREFDDIGLGFEEEDEDYYEEE